MSILIIKMNRLLISSLLLCAIQVNAEQDNLNINNRDNIPLLSKTLFLDVATAGKNLIVVGERGHILISENGINWQKADALLHSTLTTVYFRDAENGWAAGHDAVILKTTDSGKHWQEVYFAPDDETPILDIWFADNQHGIAIGAYGLYLTTADGGETWNREVMNIVDQGNEAGTDKTEDLTEMYELHLNGIVQSESGRLYIVAEAGRLYRSDDHGKTWLKLFSPYIGSFFGVLPLMQDELLVFGLRGHLYHSSDAGTSWEQIETHTRELLANGVRLQDGRIIIVGMGGTVLVSHDQGGSFTKTGSGSRHGYAAVIEKNHQLIVVGDHGVEYFMGRQPGFTDD